MSSDEILRRPAVIKKTGLPTSTLYAKIVAGKFPKPVHIGERSVGWLAGEVDTWVEARRAERDAKWQPLGNAAAQVVEKLGKARR